MAVLRNKVGCWGDGDLALPTRGDSIVQGKERRIKQRRVPYGLRSVLEAHRNAKVPPCILYKERWTMKEEVR